jgi:nitrous oxidase accessory protein NosD
MKSLRPISVIALTMLVALPRVALASNIWYVNGLNGSDSNDCKSAQSACETISQTISKATSGDSIVVAAATYTENLTISISLNVMGSSAATTIIDGGGKGIVVTISSGTVRLSNVTVRNGQSGIHNLGGTLTISNCTVSRNSFGGIFNGNASRLIINNSTVSGNTQWGNRSGGTGPESKFHRHIDNQPEHHHWQCRKWSLRCRIRRRNRKQWHGDGQQQHPEWE